MCVRALVRACVRVGMRVNMDLITINVCQIF